MKLQHTNASEEASSLRPSSHGPSGSWRVQRLCWLVVVACMVLGGASTFASAEQSTTQPSHGLAQQPPLFPQVESVIAGSAAERAGFHIGDRIIAYDSHLAAVPDTEGFRRMVWSARGRTSEVVLIRDGQAMKLFPTVPEGQILGVAFTLQQFAGPSTPAANNAGSTPASATSSNHPATVPQTVADSARAVELSAQAARAVVQLGRTLAPAPESVTPPALPEIPAADLPEPIAVPGDDGGILVEVVEFLLEVFGL